MYKNKKIICTIPARGGSKGIPGKNIKLLNGKPLIAYAIEAARKSKYVDRVIVSTDYEEIAKIAKKYKAEVPFLRPTRLATDKAQTLPVLQHAIKFLEQKGDRFELVVLIQPTAPFVLADDIDSAIESLFKNKTDSCVTICEITERPEWMYKIKNKNLKNYINTNIKSRRRQDLPLLYRLNGAVYASKKDVLMKENKIIGDSLSGVIIPRHRSLEIDEPLDFEIAELIAKKLNAK